MLKELKLIFLTMFDGNIQLFDGEVSLNLSVDTRPVQHPPAATHVTCVLVLCHHC